MQTKTHLNWNRTMFPHIPMKVLRKINHDIDNPSGAQKKIAKMYQGDGPFYFNPFDFMNLGRRSPHRRFNHDLPMLIMIGHKLYGSDGVRVAVSHAVADHISDRMKANYGRKYRDVFETLYDLYYTTR